MVREIEGKPGIDGGCRNQEKREFQEQGGCQ